MYTLKLGDSLEVLKTIPENTIDSCVTDPPYGWRFMGKAWDAPDISKVAKGKERGGVMADGRERKPRDLPAESAGTYDQTCEANRKFQEWTEAWAREVFRVLKPGAHALVFCGPRTYHRMATGLEDAGFEIRDQLQWLFGSGFPKASALLNKPGDALCQCVADKRNSARNNPLQGEVVHKDTADVLADDGLQSLDAQHLKNKLSNSQADCLEYHDSSGALAQQVQGDDLASSQRQRCVLRHNHSVSLCDGLVPESLHNPSLVQHSVHPSNQDCLRHETSRLNTSSNTQKKKSEQSPNAGVQILSDKQGKSVSAFPLCSTCGKPKPEGWYSGGLKPANEPICLARKPLSEDTVAKNVLKWRTGGLNIDGCRIEGKPRTTHADGNFPNPHTRENTIFKMKTGIQVSQPQGRFPSNLLLSHSPKCAEEACDMFECAVKHLDQQSLAGGMHSAGKAREKGNYQRAVSAFGGGNAPTMHRLGDSGGASRFFYVAKTSSKERGESTHPTMKPIRLMSYLCRLVTPPSGTVLDPFMGSGSTGMAALQEGFKFIGIEREQEYMAIAEKRIGSIL